MLLQVVQEQGHGVELVQPSPTWLCPLGHLELRTGGVMAAEKLLQTSAEPHTSTARETSSRRIFSAFNLFSTSSHADRVNSKVTTQGQPSQQSASNAATSGVRAPGCKNCRAVPFVNNTCSQEKVSRMRTASAGRHPLVLRDPS